jgi:hypothetical protein
MTSLFGLAVYVCPDMCEYTLGERLFPVSCHRSRRIHKKLVKRFGGEYRMVIKPKAIRIGDAIYIHPSLYQQLKDHLNGKASQPADLPGG